MSEYIKHQHEARQKAWHEAKALLDGAAAEKRDLSAEENAKYESISADLDTRAKVIETLKSDADREMRAAEAMRGLENQARPVAEVSSQNDDAEAIRKREAKAKREAEMQKIPDLGKAIQDAVAVMDFDKAKKLQAEEKRRKMQSVKDAGKALEDDLKPIKDSIRDELKLCMDKATLVEVVELLRGKK